MSRDITRSTTITRCPRQESDLRTPERIAARYDESAAEMFDPAVVDPAIDFLAGIAGSALEFGIGTGRIALPLAQRGVPVRGIDLSKAMVARLHAKPGAEAIAVTIGDFATTTVDEPFSLVYLIYNTIGNLTTQAAQVACFRNAAAHLEPGGCFVIELRERRSRNAPAPARGAAVQSDSRTSLRACRPIGAGDDRDVILPEVG